MTAQFSCFTAQVSPCILKIKIHLKMLVLNFHFTDTVVFSLLYNICFGVVTLSLHSILKITLNVKHNNLLTNLFVIMYRCFTILFLVKLKLSNNNQWNIHLNAFLIHDLLLKKWFVISNEMYSKNTKMFCLQWAHRFIIQLIISLGGERESKKLKKVVEVWCRDRSSERGGGGWHFSYLIF